MPKKRKPSCVTKSEVTEAPVKKLKKNTKPNKKEKEQVRSGLKLKSILVTGTRVPAR